MPRHIHIAPAGAIAITAFALATTVQAQGRPEAYFGPPQISQPQLSPDARHVALVLARNGTHGQELQLAVIDLDQGPGLAPRVVASLVEADVNSVRWVNNRRLVFDAKTRRSDDQPFVNPGLWAVDVDGGQQRQWITSRRQGSKDSKPQQSRLLPYEWRLSHVPARTGEGDSDEVVIQRLEFKQDQNTGTTLARLDVRTGARRDISADAHRNALYWVFDRQGEPLFSTGYEDERPVVRWRERPGQPWPRWSGGDMALGVDQQPLGVDGRGRVYLVQRNAEGFKGLYVRDSAAPDAPQQLLFEAPPHDVEPVLRFDRGELLGFHFETDRSRVLWLHPEMKALQAELDALLPGQINQISCQPCLGTARVLVASRSDRQPNTYLVYERGTRRLVPLGRSRPDLPLGGPRSVQSIHARDGLRMPVVITQPLAAASGPRPAIVLVGERSWQEVPRWDWSAVPQYLASLGYVVIEAGTRGQTGRGRAHFQAGWKQWGQAMQDDLEDALAWAVKQGLADGQRSCIVGSGYGGYAALMAQTRPDGRFRCAVAKSAAPDLGQLLSGFWTPGFSPWMNGAMPLLVGHPQHDAQRLSEQSPLTHAARLRGPLLLAYGELDRYLPITRARELRDALRRHGNEPEWLEYPDEYSDLFRLKNELDYWRRVDAFLARSLKPGAPEPAPDPGASAATAPN